MHISLATFSFICWQLNCKSLREPDLRSLSVVGIESSGKQEPLSSSFPMSELQ